MANRIYGIDLGTTNSAISLDGEIITGLVPSIAKFETKTAGELLREDYSAERSFKVNMSMGSEGRLSIGASSLVLKEMVRICKEKGHDVTDVVISVPAYFTSNQRLATKEAAHKIGLKVHAVANEPTVAAMEYNRDAAELSVVFDLGGGTFDISIIDSRSSTYDVLATDGIVIGGDDFDKEILKHMIKFCDIKIHHLSREMKNKLKDICAETKVKVQQLRETVTVDLSFLGNRVTTHNYELTQEDYKSLMKKTFEKCLIVTKRLVSEHISIYEDYNLLFVGGSTRCPYLKEWIENELEHKQVKQTYNPDTVVALGAAHYARLIESGEIDFMVSDVTKAIGIRKIDGTMEKVIFAGTKLPAEETIILTNPEDCIGLRLDIMQGDSLMASNNSFIGTMNYEFGEVKEARTANVEITLQVSMDGILKVSASELLKEPQEITLII